MIRKACGWTFLLCTLSAAAAGCGEPDVQQDGITVAWHIEPARPDTGIIHVAIVLTDSAGTAVDSADVTVEGIMTHPGMAPSTADASEVEAGRYVAPMHLTMRGDWILLLEAHLPDGRTLQRQHELPGVGAH